MFFCAHLTFEWAGLQKQVTPHSMCISQMFKIKAINHNPSRIRSFTVPDINGSQTRGWGPVINVRGKQINRSELDHYTCSVLMYWQVTTRFCFIFNGSHDKKGWLPQYFTVSGEIFSPLFHELPVG